MKRKTFSKDEIASAFGKKMDAGEGNRILHLVHEQRLAGTIDEDIPGSHGSKTKALVWLRQRYPVDEEQAILQRLDREELRALDSQTHQGDSVYGNPVIDQIRKHNLARQAERDAKKAKAEAEGTSERQLAKSRAIAIQEKQVANRIVWYEKYRKIQEESGLKALPEMSFIRRVGPASLMAFAVISLCVIFAQNYTPPSRAARLFPGVPMAMATNDKCLRGLKLITYPI
ncbi:MAG: hypothetical protein L6R40_002478 [Gallowayella cf. fulva]|nr:MAG: hypothetical protein L6R40_002478 [Xanthomendoza cf. fulva]